MRKGAALAVEGGLFGRLTLDVLWVTPCSKGIDVCVLLLRRSEGCLSWPRCLLAGGVLGGNKKGRGATTLKKGNGSGNSEGRTCPLGESSAFR